MEITIRKSIGNFKIKVKKLNSNNIELLITAPNDVTETGKYWFHSNIIEFSSSILIGGQKVGGLRIENETEKRFFSEIRANYEKEKERIIEELADKLLTGEIELEFYENNHRIIKFDMTKLEPYYIEVLQNAFKKFISPNFYCSDPVRIIENEVKNIDINNYDFKIKFIDLLKCYKEKYLIAQENIKQKFEQAKSLNKPVEINRYRIWKGFEKYTLVITYAMPDGSVKEVFNESD